MDIPFGEINYLAVVVGAVINMALGALWYAPFLFGKTWQRLMGRTMDDDNNPGPAFALAFVASLVAAFVLALLIVMVDSSSPLEGALAGVLVAIGFVGTSSLTNSVFEGKHFGIWGIFFSYQVVAYAIVGAVLAIW